MWNFSNGGCLKTLTPSEASGGDEVTALEYVLGGFQNKHVLGVGWNRKVTFWEDAPEKKVRLNYSRRTFAWVAPCSSSQSRDGGPHVAVLRL